MEPILSEENYLHLQSVTPTLEGRDYMIANQRMAVYERAMKSSGQPLLPKATAERQRKAEQLEALWLEGEEGWVRRAPEGESLPWDSEEARENFAAIAGLADLTGADPSDVATNPGAYRRLLGKSLGREDAATDEDIRTVYDQRRGQSSLMIGSEGKRDGALLPSMTKDAAAGRPFDQAWREWNTISKTNPNYDPSKEADYMAAARRQYSRETEKRAKLMPVAEEIFESLLRQTGKAEGPAKVRDAARGLAGLTGDEKDQIGVYLAEMAETLPESEDGVLSKSIKSIWRPIARLSYGSPAPGFGNDISHTEFQEMVRTGDKDADSGKLAMLNAERRRDLIRLRDIANGVIDPVEKGEALSWGNLYYGGLETAASMATFAVPVIGPGMNFSAYTEEAKLDALEAGSDVGTANILGGTIGMAQAAADRLQLGILKRVPGISQITSKGAGAYLTRGVGALAGETAIETIQDPIAPAVVKNVFSALGADVESVEMRPVLEEAWAQIPELAVSMAIPIMLGSGVATAKDIKGSIQDDRMRLELTALGYSEQAVGDVMAAGSREEAAAVINENWNSRDPESPAALEAQAERQAAIDEAPEMEAAANKQAGIEKVTRTPEGWVIELEDGGQLEADSEQAAEAIRTELGHARTEREAAAIVEVEDWLAGMEGATAEEISSFTGELATADAEGVTFSKNGEVTRLLDDETTVGEAMREVELLNRREAGSAGAEMVGLVAGSNVLGNIRDDVSQLARIENYQGGTVLTQIHERVEARWRSGLERGLFTIDDSKAIVRAVEEATGLKFLEEGDGETALREAISEIVVADVLSRRKDGSRVPSGAISGGLTEAIRKVAETKGADGKTLGKFQSFLRAARAYFKQVLKTAGRLARARNRGELEDGGDVDLFIGRLLGMEEQIEHNAEVEEIVDEDPDYTPPTEEDLDNGIAFSIRPNPFDRNQSHTYRNGKSFLAAEIVSGEYAADSVSDALSEEDLAGELGQSLRGGEGARGILGIEPDSRVLVINGLEIDPEFRGQGEGRRMVMLAEKDAIEAGAQYAALFAGTTDDKSGPSGPFYKKLGYDAKYFTPWADAIMVKELEEPASNSEIAAGFTFAVAPLPEVLKDTRVVDSKGDPKVVFHGTPDVRGLMDGFTPKFRGEAYFFTDSKRVAKTYADPRRAMDYQGSEPFIVPVYLGFKNPKKIQGAGRPWRNTEAEIEKAREEGHDSIIIYNSRDDYSSKDSGEREVPSTVYVAFSSEQITAASNDDLISPVDGKNLGKLNFSMADANYLGAVEADSGFSKVSEKFDASRVGTANQGTVRPTEQDNNVGMETVLPDKLKKQMSALTHFDKKWKLPKSVTRFRNPERRRDAFIDFAKSNLLALYNAFPEDLRERASHWYDGARVIAETIGKQSNVTTEQAAGFLAVFSPMKDWYQNVQMGVNFADVANAEFGTKITKKKYAQAIDEIVSRTGEKSDPLEVREQAKADRRRILEATIGKSIDQLWATGLESDQVLAAWAVRLITHVKHGADFDIVTPEGESMGLARKVDGTPAKMVWQSSAFIIKAIEIAKDGSLESISRQLGSQHKIRSFYNNIIAPNSPYGDSTQDTHAINAASLFPMGNKGTLVNQNFGGKGAGGSVGGNGNKGTYWLYHEAYKQAAEELGIQPRQLQSIAWEAVRQLFPDRMKRKKNWVAEKAKLWETLSDEDARSAILEPGIGRPSWAGGIDGGSSAGAGISAAEVSSSPGAGGDAGGSPAARRGLGLPRSRAGQFAFSMADGNYLERIASEVTSMRKPPEQRRQAWNKAKRRLEDLALMLQGSDPVETLSSKAAINRARRERKAELEDQYVNEVWDNYGEALSVPAELTKITEQNAIKWIMRPHPTGGNNPLTIIESKSKAKKRGAYNARDYEGSQDLPRWMFTGSTVPSEVAKMLYAQNVIPADDVDLMYSALHQAVKDSDYYRRTLEEAELELRSAKRRAKTEADSWAEDQISKIGQASRKGSRSETVKAIRALDAALVGLPAEVRGKIGGFTQMAGLATDKSREKLLRARVGKADLELEKFLQKEYADQLSKLLKSGLANREGGEKPTGNIGVEASRFFDKVAKVVELSPTEIASMFNSFEQLERDLLAGPLEGAELNAALADVHDDRRIFDVYGGVLYSEKGLGSRTAAEMNSALDDLQAVYTTGRNAWRAVEEARLADVEEKRQMVMRKMGKTSFMGRKREDHKRKAKLKFLSDLRYSGVSWAQMLEAILGKGDPLADRWNKLAAGAMAQKTDRLIENRARLEGAMRKAMPEGTSQLQAMQRMFDMQTEETIKVRKREGAGDSGELRAQKFRVPVSKLIEVKEGTLDPASLDVPAEALADLLEQYDSRKPGSTRKFYETEIADPGAVDETATLTEAEAISLTLLARQEQYRENLELWGWTEEAIGDAEAGLSDEGKAMREWLAREYADGYAPLARVFRRMNGVDLPQIQNYSPAAAHHDGMQIEMDAQGGALMPEGGLRAGMLKTRKAHKAEMKIQSAFSTYYSHVNQSEHYIAFGELTRELRGVFSSQKVGKAIDARLGKEVSQKVLTWIDTLQANGRTTGAKNDAPSKTISNFQSRLAKVALAGKLGTLMVQSSAAFASTANIGTGNYFRSLSRVMRDPGKIKAFFDSPIIQRRILGGVSPLQRVAMQSHFQSRPNRASVWVEKLLELIGTVDGAFTSISGAVAYEHHYTRNLEDLKMGEAEARRQALIEAEDVVRRTAQPVEMTDKSLFEVDAGPIVKFAMLFGSESRKNVALVSEAIAQYRAGKIEKNELGGALMFVFILNGALTHLIRSAWWDARDDDDDELFDDKHWSAWALIQATMTAPLQGIPLVRDAISGFSDRGELEGVIRGFESAKYLAKATIEQDFGNEPVEKIERLVLGIVNGLALVNDAAVPVAVAGNMFDQLFDVGDNVIDDDEEAERKEARAERKAAKEKREAESE